MFGVVREFRILIAIYLIIVSRQQMCSHMSGTIHHSIGHRTTPFAFNRWMLKKLEIIEPHKVDCMPTLRPCLVSHVCMQISRIAAGRYVYIGVAAFGQRMEKMQANPWYIQQSSLFDLSHTSPWHRALNNSTSNLSYELLDFPTERSAFLSHMDKGGPE